MLSVGSISNEIAYAYSSVGNRVAELTVKQHKARQAPYGKEILQRDENKTLKQKRRREDNKKTCDVGEEVRKTLKTNVPLQIDSKRCVFTKVQQKINKQAQSEVLNMPDAAAPCMHSTANTVMWYVLKNTVKDVSWTYRKSFLQASNTESGT